MIFSIRLRFPDRFGTGRALLLGKECVRLRRHARLRWGTAQSGGAAREVLVSVEADVPPAPSLADLGRLLSPARVCLSQAASRRDALDRIEAGGVDLAVLWAGAAGYYGLRTLEIIRAVAADLPCVLVTPDTGMLTLRRALELRAYSVIRQPVDSRMLAALLLRILRKKLG